MSKYILVISLSLVPFIFVIANEPNRAPETQQSVKWDFDPAKLAQKICQKNNWQFKGEYTNPFSQKHFHHFRFFEVIKAVDKSTANLFILVISSDQKDYILHQTLTFEDIEVKESFYPQNKDEALEIAILKEELSKNYNLWSPYYSLTSKVVKEDRDNLLWKITFTYHRPALRTLPGPVYGGNEKPPVMLVPEKESLPLPPERHLTRIIKLIHPLKFEIEKLIGLLGNDDWRTREKATDDLIAIGRPVVSSLKEALNHPDPEVRMRAKLILKEIK